MQHAICNTLKQRMIAKYDYHVCKLIILVTSLLEKLLMNYASQNYCVECEPNLQINLMNNDDDNKRACEQQLHLKCNFINS